MYKYKAAVFDLDGTLINSLEDLADCVNIALKENGLKTYSTEKYKDFIGNGKIVLIERAMGEKSLDTEFFDGVSAAFDREYELKYCKKTTLYPGIKNMLLALKTAGVRLAVLSNKPDRFVRPIIDKLLPNILDAAWGNRPGIPTKPEPTSLNLLLDELGVSRDETLYIGDSQVDFLTAQNAGVDFCAVSWGFYAAFGAASSSDYASRCGTNLQEKSSCSSPVSVSAENFNAKSDASSLSENSSRCGTNLQKKGFPIADTAEDILNFMKK